MARIARIVLPRQPHLVSQAGRKSIFATPQRCQAYLDILAGCAATYRMKLLAWSVLPQRVLLVAVPPSAEAMGSFMRVAHARYSRHLRTEGFRGAITGGRFASCPLDEQAALEAIKFVESAPVVEGLTDSPLSYPFASAACRLDGNGKLLCRNSAITGGVNDWQNWLTEPLPAERHEYLALRMRTGKPAGSQSFVTRVERKLGMNLSRSRGRPKARA